MAMKRVTCHKRIIVYHVCDFSYIFKITLSSKIALQTDVAGLKSKENWFYILNAKYVEYSLHSISLAWMILISDEEGCQSSCGDPYSCCWYIIFHNFLFSHYRRRDQKRNVELKRKGWNEKFMNLRMEFCVREGE